eukprot:TRINITY_DN22307_c0_g1_i1.p1 TRINITY_DN22307_c0_g1~~TRINITY_DN22307_c0_g1_i1.p1  ORF type:complete len:1828 (+),score=594.45 TRINITY_DN22307_c0_g1_i1:103-5586(+)
MDEVAGAARAADAATIALLQRQVDAWRRLAEARGRELAGAKKARERDAVTSVSTSGASPPPSAAPSTSTGQQHNAYVSSPRRLRLSAVEVSAPPASASLASSCRHPGLQKDVSLWTIGAPTPDDASLTPEDNSPACASDKPGAPQADPNAKALPFFHLMLPSAPDVATLEAKATQLSSQLREAESQLNAAETQRDQAEELCIAYAEKEAELTAKAAAAGHLSEQLDEAAARIEELEATVVGLQCQIASQAFASSFSASSRASSPRALGDTVAQYPPPPASPLQKRPAPISPLSVATTVSHSVTPRVASGPNLSPHDGSSPMPKALSMSLEARLQKALSRYLDDHGMHATVSTVVMILACKSDSWPKTADAFRTVILSRPVPEAEIDGANPNTKRFADGLGEAADMSTQREVQFYRPTWYPSLDHWATVGELKGWMDPLGNNLWDRTVIKGMLHNIRFISRHHHHEQSPEVVVPLSAYTLQLFEDKVGGVWDGAKGEWVVLPFHPFNPEQATRRRMSSVSALESPRAGFTRSCMSGAAARAALTLTIPGARHVAQAVNLPVPQLLTMEFLVQPPFCVQDRHESLSPAASPTGQCGRFLFGFQHGDAPSEDVTFYRGVGTGGPVLLATYSNPRLSHQPARCPYYDSIMWLTTPPDALLDTAGQHRGLGGGLPVMVDGALCLPSPVLEYINSRDADEVLSSEGLRQHAGHVPWDTEPVHDDMVDALLRSVAGVGNTQRYDRSVHFAMEVLIARGGGAPLPAFATAAHDALAKLPRPASPAPSPSPSPRHKAHRNSGMFSLDCKDAESCATGWMMSDEQLYSSISGILVKAFEVIGTRDKPIPADIAAVLQLQHFTYAGSSYLLSFSSPAVRMIADCCRGVVRRFWRLARSCKEQIFRTLNGTMRSLQAKEIKPLLKISGQGQFDGDYCGGDFVEPFVRTTPSAARAEWARGGFNLYLGKETATIVERLSEGWQLLPRGSMIHQVKGLLFYIDRALQTLPAPTPEEVGRTPEGLILCYRGLAGVQVPKYTQGSTLLWAAFSSASLDPCVACVFAQGSATVFSVKTLPNMAGGKNIAKWSRFSREKELLFASNTWLRVANALTTELSRLAGVENENSQLFELEAVCPKTVYCSRLRALLPKARTAAAACSIFQMEQALSRGDGVVDLSLPSAQVGETATFWQMQVGVEQHERDRCPVSETNDWVTIPDHAIPDIKRIRRYAVKQWTNALSNSLASTKPPGNSSRNVGLAEFLDLASSATPQGSRLNVHDLRKVPSISLKFQAKNSAVASEAGESRQEEAPPRLFVPGIIELIVDNDRDEGHDALVSLCRLLDIDAELKRISHMTFQPGQRELEPRFSIHVQGRIPQQTAHGQKIVRVWRAMVRFRRREGRPSLAIGHHGAVLLADAIRMQLPLKELHLLNNRIPPAGVAYLLEAVRENMNVEDVELDQPPTTAQRSQTNSPTNGGLSTARRHWGFLKDSLSSIIKRQSFWFDGSVYTALKMRCMSHRKEGIGLSQLRGFGSKWPKHAVLAFWDVIDVASVLPIAELNESEQIAMVDISRSLRDELVDDLKKRMTASMPTLSWILHALGREWMARKATTPDHLILLAARLGRVSIVHSLVFSFPFNLAKVADETCQTPLLLACRSKAFDNDDAQETLKLLLNAKSKKMIDLVNGWSPLHAATQAYNMVVVKSLLAWGLDANVHDYEGRTALQLAVELGYHAIIELLEPHTSAMSGERYRRRTTKRERSKQCLQSFLSDDLQDCLIPDIVTETRAAIILQLNWKKYKAHKVANELTHADRSVAGEDAQLVAEMIKQAGSAEIAAHFVRGTHSLT